MKAEKMPKLRKGSRVIGGPMDFLVSVDTRIDGDIVLPPDRYRGTVAWKETATRSGVERSKNATGTNSPQTTSCGGAATR